MPLRTLKATKQYTVKALATLGSIASMLAYLKLYLNYLRKVLKSTTSDKPAPESSSPTPQQGPSAQDTETTSSSANKESQPTSNTKTKKSYKGDRDRKLNVVIYGIDECEKGALRHERMNQDLQKSPLLSLKPKLTFINT